jgi:hypothetical protein
MVVDPTNVLLVRMHKGQFVRNPLTIARDFCYPHKNVLQSLDELGSNRKVNRPDFKPIKYMATKGEQRGLIKLTERREPITMPFIGGRDPWTEQVRLVDAFLALRAELEKRFGKRCRSMKNRCTLSASETHIFDAPQRCRHRYRAVQAISATTVSNYKAAILAAYRDMDDDWQDFIRRASQSLTVEFKRQRVRHMLIRSDEASPRKACK